MSEREQFEAWWMSDVPEEHRVFAKKLLDGYGPDYTAAAGVADAWESWQASRRAALEEIGMILTDSSKAHLAVRINYAMELIDSALANGDT